MQETFIVTVTTEDGAWSIRKKINSDCVGSLLALLQFFRHWPFQSKDSSKLETLVGFGTGLSASDSLLPTPS